MDKTKNSLLTKSHIGGYRVADLIGLALMIIPFFISLQSFDSTKRVFLWFTKHVTVNIQPTMITATCSVAFYVALILRYNFFKASNLLETLVSIVRTFLNCWVIAALISTIVNTDNPSKIIPLGLLSFNTFTVLFFAVLLTWLGMKTIAGYSWILFILLALHRWEAIDKAMGMKGAVFIISFAISLLLQIGDPEIIKDFINDFKVGAKKYTSSVKGDIQTASEDVAKKADTVKRFVSANVSAYTPIKMPTTDKSEAAKPKNVSVNYAALDVNKDGVVDEKDFILLSKMKDDTKADN